MKKFNVNIFGGEPIEIVDDKFTAKFEHIATSIPLEIDLVENEFNLLTTKTDVDANTQQAWLSMWLRDTDMNKGGSADSDIEEFFKDFFFEGVFKNGQLRSH